MRMRSIGHTVRVLACVMMASALAVAAAHAGSPFSFNDVPGKLSKTVVPIHYAIDLKPDLDNLTIAGSEAVELEVKAPTDKLVLNAVRMTFSAASIDGVGNARVAFDADAETVTLTFPQPLEVGRHTLRIVFTARINERVGGGARSEYRWGERRKRMFLTHLQPDEARQVFPSWDEPAFKATFDLTVTVPRNFLAVSNMPVAQEAAVAATLKRVSFRRTPVMPTYIFALVAGELERTTVEIDGVTIGVVSAPGKGASAR